MSFQRCPICLGQGVTRSEHTTAMHPCETCQGKRIINAETGEPPKTKIKIEGEVPDEKPDELLKPMNPLDESSEEEIQYWATPTYDELQAKKEARANRTKENPEP